MAWNAWSPCGIGNEAGRSTAADHLGVIEAMDRLSEDWRDRAAFDALHRMAAAANAAY